MIQISPNIYPAVVASEFFSPDQPANSTGWGNRNELHFTNTVSLSDETCEAELGTIWNHLLNDQTLCVRASTGSSICSNGNPLVSNNVLVGIQMWEAWCGSGHPSMHVRVHHFRDWIELTARN